jgi:hypothetical protein
MASVRARSLLQVRSCISADHVAKGTTVAWYSHAAMAATRRAASVRARCGVVAASEGRWHATEQLWL